MGLGEALRTLFSKSPGTLPLSQDSFICFITGYTANPKGGERPWPAFVAERESLLRKALYANFRQGRANGTLYQDATPREDKDGMGLFTLDEWITLYCESNDPYLANRVEKLKKKRGYLRMLWIRKNGIDEAEQRWRGGSKGYETHQPRVPVAERLA